MQSQLEVLMHWKDLQDIEIVRLYPTEWETIPYSLNYKPLTLYWFNNKRVSILASLLFLVASRTSGGEWFHPHQGICKYFIRTFIHLVHIFTCRNNKIIGWFRIRPLSLIFEDETEVCVPSLLVTEWRVGETFKTFIGRFLELSVQYS